MTQKKFLGKICPFSYFCVMKKPYTKSDYKRKKREVKRTSQKLSYQRKKTKFIKGDIVKLKDGDDMGYVMYYKGNMVFVNWTKTSDYHLELDLIKVV